MHPKILQSREARWVKAAVFAEGEKPRMSEADHPARTMVSEFRRQRELEY